ncbi:MAG: endonuclease/exonuclease/phosphatase family protein [Rhodobacteraceae bacterium]|nr:endonuclease/exonuclease/phosphatase family protein [Paracoccaceae bacterium]
MADHPAAGTIESTVKVLTWNLWWRFGPWEDRATAILATLKSVDADIICLQEVWDDGDRNFAAKLAEALGFDYVYAPGAKPNGVFMGNAILSRWQILDHQIRSLFDQKNAEEMRVAIHADIDGPRGRLPVFCTHLNWQLQHSNIRQMQVMDLTVFIEQTKPWKYPPILCGDFNAEAASDEVRMLTGHSTGPVENLVFYDAWAFVNPQDSGITWDNRNPYVAQDFEQDRRIDYIFVAPPKMRGRGHIVDCQIVGNRPVDSVWPSDHSAVLATLRY